MDGSTFTGAFARPDGDDGWLDALLHADAARQPHLDDAGFSARVMRALPAPRRNRSPARWMVPAMAAVGGGLALGFTPAPGYLLRNAYWLFDLHHLSLAQCWVLVPVALLYACSFGAARQS